MYLCTSRTYPFLALLPSGNNYVRPIIIITVFLLPPPPSVSSSRCKSYLFRLLQRLFFFHAEIDIRKCLRLCVCVRFPINCAYLLGKEKLSKTSELYLFSSLRRFVSILHLDALNLSPKQVKREIDRHRRRKCETNYMFSFFSSFTAPSRDSFFLLILQFLSTIFFLTWCDNSPVRWRKVNRENQSSAAIEYTF